MPIVCPIHEQQDMVQSIPALVSEDTSRGTFSGPSGGVTFIDGKRAYTAGTTTLYGTLTTDIAEKLAAPPQPKEISFFGFVGYSFLFLFSICIVVGPFLVWPAFKDSIVKNPKYQEKTFGNGGNGFLIFMLILGWHPMLWFFIPSLLKNLKDKSEYSRRYNLWVDAYHKWETLYYCHRCGIVLDPQKKQYYKPNQLRNQLCVDDYL